MKTMEKTTNTPSEKKKRPRKKTKNISTTYGKTTTRTKMIFTKIKSTKTEKKRTSLAKKQKWNATSGRL